MKLLSHLRLCNPMDCSLTTCLNSWDFPGKSTGVGCHYLLQRIFLTQRSNPGLPHCRQTLYHLSLLGSPQNLVVFHNSLGFDSLNLIKRMRIVEIIKISIVASLESRTYIYFTLTISMSLNLYPVLRLCFECYAHLFSLLV